jgi:hypothetical protein
MLAVWPLFWIPIANRLAEGLFGLHRSLLLAYSMWVRLEQQLWHPPRYENSVGVLHVSRHSTWLGRFG